jgi:phosphoribosylglycinamide formyltransferase 1
MSSRRISIFWNREQTNLHGSVNSGQKLLRRKENRELFTMAERITFRIAVLISGGGTTLRNLIDKIDAGLLPVEIGLVISSSPGARGLQFARDANIPSAVVERKAFADQDAFSREIFDRCRGAKTDLVVMAGFLKRVTIPEDFSFRVVNIHPALIPAFCGEGFYGHHVHEAVLNYGAKLTGCTVHFADNQYDHGPVIVQRSVPVLDDDTPETLAARVFEAECEAYPEALRLIATGRVALEGRRARILSEEDMA